MEEPESVVALVVAGFGVTMAFSSADSRSAKDVRLVLGVSFIDALLAEVSVSCGVAMDVTMSIQARKEMQLHPNVKRSGCAR